MSKHNRERRQQRRQEGGGNRPDILVTDRAVAKDGLGVVERVAKSFFGQVPCPLGCEVWLAGRTIIGSYTLTVIRTEQPEKAPDPNLLVTYVDFVETKQQLKPIRGAKPSDLVGADMPAIGHGWLMFCRYGPAVQLFSAISPRDSNLTGVKEVQSQAAALAAIAALVLVPGNVIAV